MSSKARGIAKAAAAAPAQKKAPPKSVTNTKKRKAEDEAWPEDVEEAIGFGSEDEMESSDDSQDVNIQSTAASKANLSGESDEDDSDQADDGSGSEGVGEKPEDLFKRRKDAFREDDEEKGEMGDDEWNARASAAATQAPRKSAVEELDELGEKYDSMAFLKTTKEEDPDLFYDSEDSENERTLNTIGDTPIHWYDDMEHIGYDLEGHPVAKPEREDLIDQFITMNEHPQGWRTVYDEKTGQKIVISDRDMDYIRRLQKGELPEKYDSEKWFIPIEGRVSDVMPTFATPEPKRRFVPSLWEAKRIRRLAHAIRKGWIKLDKPEKKKEEHFFLIWGDQPDEAAGGYHPERLLAPKPRLPGHAESYNPPAEYLLTEEEYKEWSDADPLARPNYVPRKYNSLREVPGWANYHKERFERCLDLYLVTRAKRKKPKFTLNDLIPQLPKPAELRPFPAQESLLFLGHEGRVRCISVDPTGQWLASGSDDNTIRLWEIKTTRCAKIWTVPSPVLCLEWNPSAQLAVLAVALETELRFYASPLGSVAQQAAAEVLFESEVSKKEHLKGAIEWEEASEEEQLDGLRLSIKYKGKQALLRSMTWHHKGDYLATVCPDAPNNAVVIHQLSKHQSQSPFKKNKGKIQCVRFHPTKPFFFVASQRFIRVYNLVKQELVKKLVPGVQWISSLEIHPGGDNLIIGTYDKKVCWFDLDLSVKPYRTMRYHEYCIRSVRFHKKYPLFASCSDDGTVQVFHSTVYDDLLSNPLIVPLKILRGHKVIDDLGVLDIAFHPAQPWVFSAGADKSIRLYC